MDEFGLINKIKKTAGSSAGKLIRGIGDDCAVFSPAKNKKILVSSDSLAEGVHFNLKYIKPESLGKKTAAVNISDIYAMGGVPKYMLLNLGLPLKKNTVNVHKIIKSFSDYSEKHGARLIGGDTVRAGTFFLSVMVIGEARQEEIMMRTGAKPGDRLFITGTPGESAAGLYAFENPQKCAGIKGINIMKKKHTEPEPGLSESRAAAKSGMVTSCLDISDGIVSDAYRISEESACAVCIEYEKLPVSKRLAAFAEKIKKVPEEFVLYGGEDYGLLFTVSGKKTDDFGAYCGKHGLRAVEIGYISAGRGVYLDIDGKKQKADSKKTWKHF
ncbi:MAG: thiamine-phosphate kinase [Candidatus Goldiibacteriota bacterium]